MSCRTPSHQHDAAFQSLGHYRKREDYPLPMPDISFSSLDSFWDEERDKIVLENETAKRLARSACRIRHAGKAMPDPAGRHRAAGYARPDQWP